MPAKDRYHDAVKRALEKDGWTITQEQVKIISGTRRLWIDLLAEKNNSNLAILVEIKGFESGSPADELEKSVGQYMTYLAALTTRGLNIPLYLAVPDKAFYGIFNEELGLQIRRQFGVRIVVFDPQDEAIIEWTPSPTE